MQQVNLIAPLLLCQQLLDELKAAKGSVVNVTSIAGFRVHPFAGAAYAVSKAALSALTRELAHELAEFDVRVNAVAPGETIAPLSEFGEPRYSSMTMQQHMDTTLGNLREGVPSWDPETNTSRSATYVYN